MTEFISLRTYTRVEPNLFGSYDLGFPKSSLQYAKFLSPNQQYQHPTNYTRLTVVVFGFKIHRVMERIYEFAQVKNKTEMTSSHANDSNDTPPIDHY